MQPHTHSQKNNPCEQFDPCVELGSASWAKALLCLPINTLFSWSDKLGCSPWGNLPQGHPFAHIQQKWTPNTHINTQAQTESNAVDHEYTLPTLHTLRAFPGSDCVLPQTPKVLIFIQGLMECSSLQSLNWSTPLPHSHLCASMHLHPTAT